MTGPGGRSRANRQAASDTTSKKKPRMSEDDSLRVEAYGPRGAALRKMTGAAASDSTIGQKAKARVGSFFRKLRDK